MPKYYLLYTKQLIFNKLQNFNKMSPFFVVYAGIIRSFIGFPGKGTSLCENVWRRTAIICQILK